MRTRSLTLQTQVEMCSGQRRRRRRRKPHHGWTDSDLFLSCHSHLALALVDMVSLGRAWEDGSKDDCLASEQRCPIAKRGYDFPTTRLGSARSTTWPLMVEMMKCESLREKQRRNYRNFHISSEWGWCPRMWINHSLVWWWEDRWWSKCGKLRNWIESLLVQAPIIGGECSNTHLVYVYAMQ